MSKYLPNQKSAFTLIELLVVIAIIAILAAILFPVFARARENARRTSCISNMKQVGLGLLQYSQDFDETLPQGTNAPGIPVGWGGQVYAYVKSQQVFVCPNDNTQIGGSYIGSYTPFSYGYNMSIGAANFRGVGAALAAFNGPSKTIMVFETTNTPVGLPNFLNNQENSGSGSTVFSSPAGNGVSGRLFRQSGTIGGLYATGITGGRVAEIEPLGQVAISNPQTAPYPNRFYTGEGRLLGDTGRHLEGSNYLFIDGHVKWLKGANVSTGDVANTPTSAQTGTSAPYSSGGSQAAGTEVASWAATFSPR